MEAERLAVRSDRLRSEPQQLNVSASPHRNDVAKRGDAVYAMRVAVPLVTGLEPQRRVDVYVQGRAARDEQSVGLPRRVQLQRGDAADVLQLADRHTHDSASRRRVNINELHRPPRLTECDDCDHDASGAETERGGGGEEQSRCRFAVPVNLACGTAFAATHRCRCRCVSARLTDAAAAVPLSPLSAAAAALFLDSDTATCTGSVFDCSLVAVSLTRGRARLSRIAMPPRAVC